MSLVYKRPQTDEAVLRKIFSRAYFSSVFAIICGCLGQIVGNIVLGNRFSEDKLAVISLVLPIYYVFATIGNLAGIGGSALCARLIGERKTDDCKKAFTATCIITYGLSAFFSVLFIIFLPQIITLLKTPAELYADAYDYALVMIAGGAFIAGVYISFNMLRLDGKPLATTLNFVIMVTVNIALDFLLAPLGLKGIALASVAGNCAASLFGVIIIAKKSSTLGFTKISFREFLNWAKQIFKIGSPGATENGSILLKSYFFNLLIVSALGGSALTSLSVVNSVNSFSLAITVGCAGALVPFVSVFSAERDTVSLRKMLKASLSISFVILLVFSALTAILAPQIAKLFGVVNGADETVTAIRIFSASLPVALFSNTLIYFHLASSHTVIANVLTALHSFVFPVGAAVLLFAGFGAVGVWISFCACEVLTLLSAAVLHFLARKKYHSLSPFLLLDTRFEQDGKIFADCTNDTNEGISEILSELTKFCEDNELSPKQSMLITLSMDEMMHLAATYSTPESKYRIISLRVLIHKDVLIMRLRYDGKIFNPIAYYEEKKSDTSDIDSMLALTDMLGMKLVTDTCNIVDYRSTFDINNLTIII